MTGSKIMLVLVFLSAMIASGLLAERFYRQTLQQQTSTLAALEAQRVQTISERLQTQWTQALARLGEEPLRILQHGASYPRSLSLILSSQPLVRQAIVVNNRAIYLPGWEKARADLVAEDLSLEILDNTQFKQAELLEFQEGKFAEAVAIYERFWLDNPNNYHAANALARCLVKQGAFERAQPLYAHIYDRNPDLEIQGGLPMAVVAGFQLLDLDQNLGNSRAAQAFGLKFYQDLVEDRWKMSKTRLDFCLARWENFMRPYLAEPALRPEWARIRKRTARVEDDKRFLALMGRRILPLLESRPPAGPEVLFYDPPRTAPTFLLALPFSDGQVLLDVDYPAFVTAALGAASENLVKDFPVGIRLEIGERTRVFGPGAGTLIARVPLSAEFPGLVAVVTRPALPAAAPLAARTRSVRLWAAGTLAFMLVLVLAFLALYRQVQLAEMKSYFVSQVSHELKTPLTSLRMFSELLLKGDRVSAPKRRQYYEIIQQETIRLSRLIENLLDLSRVERRKQHYHFQAEDAAEVARAAAQLFGSTLGAAAGRLRLEAGGPAPVWADKDALQQLLINLLDNAAKFSPADTPIRLACCVRDDGAELSVTDAGAGMTRAEVRRIFRKFYQAPRTYQTRFKGIGLGLAIVSHIVRAHRGRIAVTSAPDQGTTVRVWLPKPEKGVHPRGTEVNANTFKSVHHRGTKPTEDGPNAKGRKV